MQFDVVFDSLSLMIYLLFCFAVVLPKPDWAAWSAWSDCSSSCGAGSGVSVRKRACQTKDCDDQEEQVKRCHSKIKCPGKNTFLVHCVRINKFK